MRPVKRIRLFGALVFVALLAVLAGWYLTFTAERARYLTSRNYRILTTIATQVDTSIAAQERMFVSLLSLRAAPEKKPAFPRNGSAAPSPQPPAWFDEARRVVPSLAFVDESRVPEGWVGRVVAKATGVRTDNREVTLFLSFAQASDAAGETREIPFALGRLLDPILRPKLLDGAFSTLLLATTDGRVLYATGERQAEVMLTRLDALEPTRRQLLPFGNDRAEQPPAPRFASIARSAGVVDISISGTDYKLFTQPCCQTVVPPDAPDVGPAPTSPPPARGLVVAGLVNASEFNANTREISATVVVMCIAVILLALAGWPFLKIWLIGERQRARRRDVVAVAGCGIFGLALLTIISLDIYAYRGLNGARDQQLAAFGDHLSMQLKRELGAAYRQLSCFQSVALKPEVQLTLALAGEIYTRDELRQCQTSSVDPNRQRQPAVVPAGASAGAGSIGPAYPFFQTFSLIDRNGRQRVKWGPRDWVPAPIDVDARSYFTEVTAGRAWRLEECPTTGCILESIWSWTTARQEAVVSMPTGNEEMPVAALATRMMSVINPVIAEGFEFAIIDDTGLVLFHSDPQRNLHENLFQETDQNRQLRAAVAAHSRELLDLRYAGRSYRAHLARAGVGNWSVVTLHSKEPGWALHTEWLVIAVALLTFYVLVWSALLAPFLWLRKSDWLWPDALRQHRYNVLSRWLLVLLVAGAGTLIFTRGGLRLALSFLLPLCGWVITYLMLRRRAGDRDQGQYSRTPYARAAVLLLLLTSVVPATGFFTAAYGVQVRTYVKHVQLKLAQAAQQRADRLGRAEYHPVGVDRAWVALQIRSLYDVHYQFFSNSQLTDDSSGGSAATEVDSNSSLSASMIAASQQYLDGGFMTLLEEYLPYYSERSVQMRELLRDAADDSAWSWGADASQMRLRLAASGDQPAMRVESFTPQLLEGLRPVGKPWVGWLVGAALLVAGLALAIVRFIETHVYLVGVDQPLARRAGISGTNLSVVRDASAAELGEDTFELNLQQLASSPMPDQAWVRTLMDMDRKGPGQPVLIHGFDENLDDLELTSKKLAWIEELACDQTRTVVVSSSATPTMVEHTLRVARDPRLLERWAAVVATFAANWRNPAADASGTAPRAHAHQAAHDALDAEGKADAFVRVICNEIRAQVEKLQLSREQVLDEVSERAEAWYRRLWKGCNPDEQLVLAEIADDGFVNYKNRRTVRRLLGRGLAAKDPNFRLMNETFRRFVQSPPCQADVRAIEGGSDPSRWDELRVPFFVGLIGAALFFMFTQRELFNATVAAMTTLAMAMPVLVRVLGFMAGTKIGSDDLKALTKN
jgi:hypothetical protein